MLHLVNLILALLGAMPSVAAKPEQPTVAVSCSDQRMPVQHDKQIVLPTTMDVYARFSAENGFSIELDQAGFDSVLDRLSVPKVPGWTGQKALLRSRLRAANSHRPIRINDLLHADERPDHIPRKSPAIHRYIEIDSQWMQIFVIGMARGLARVIDANGRHALKHIRLRSYGSRTPLKNDPEHWVEGILVTASGRTVCDYCMVGSVTAPGRPKPRTGH